MSGRWSERKRAFLRVLPEEAAQSRHRRKCRAYAATIAKKAVIDASEPGDIRNAWVG